MPIARVLRVGTVAAALAFLFHTSQQATLQSTGETVPGARWAVAALGLFFLLGAFAFENTRGADDNIRKDLFWGLGTGGLIAALWG